MDVCCEIGTLTFGGWFFLRGMGRPFLQPLRPSPTTALLGSQSWHCPWPNQIFSPIKEHWSNHHPLNKVVAVVDVALILVACALSPKTYAFCRGRVRLGCFSEKSKKLGVRKRSPQTKQQTSKKNKKPKP